jgi:hypothetical protein
MKSASLEFKSFLELQDCRVQGLHFPFVVILDYRYCSLAFVRGDERSMLTFVAPRTEAIDYRQ